MKNMISVNNEDVKDIYQLFLQESGDFEGTVKADTKPISITIPRKPIALFIDESEYMIACRIRV